MTVNEMLKLFETLYPKGFQGAEHLAAWLPIYRDVLAQLEGDALARGVQALVSKWKYQSAPKPADVLEAIEGSPRKGRAGNRLRNLTDDELRAEWRAFPAMVERTGHAGAYAVERLEREAERRGTTLYGAPRDRQEAPDPRFARLIEELGGAAVANLDEDEFEKRIAEIGARHGFEAAA